MMMGRCYVLLLPDFLLSALHIFFFFSGSAPKDMERVASLAGLGASESLPGPDALQRAGVPGPTQLDERCRADRPDLPALRSCSASSSHGVCCVSAALCRAGFGWVGGVSDWRQRGGTRVSHRRAWRGRVNGPAECKAGQTLPDKMLPRPRLGSNSIAHRACQGIFDGLMFSQSK